MDINIFEYATQKALRFESAKGPLSVEDLWNLKLISTVGSETTLNTVAASVYESLQKTTSVVNFIDSKVVKNYDDEVRMAVVKHIIDVKVKARDAEKTKRERSALRQEILAIQHQKDRESLLSKTPEELAAMLKGLDAED